MGIKPYPTCDVVLTYQNFGSAWLGILNGPPEQVVQVFNGLYNLGATNGDCENQEGTDLTLFWTSPRQLRKFFFYYFFNPRASGWLRQGKLARRAMRYAVAKVALLRSTSHEAYFDFKRARFSNPFNARVLGLTPWQRCGRVGAYEHDFVRSQGDYWRTV